MKRYLLAILIACSFSLLGWMDDSASVDARGKVEASFIEADRAQAERNVLEEYGNDIFRTATDFSPVVHSSRSTSQIRCAALMTTASSAPDTPTANRSQNGG